jgi:hypothetical protein
MAPPDDRLREAIQIECAANAGLDCFVASLLAMTGRVQRQYHSIVMAGLDPAIHVLSGNIAKAWMRES